MSKLASLLPGVFALLLPKCPLCVAAWLTALTGIGISAATVSWVRSLALAFTVVAVLVAVVHTWRGRTVRR